MKIFGNKGLMILAVIGLATFASLTTRSSTPLKDASPAEKKEAELATKRRHGALALDAALEVMGEPVDVMEMGSSLRVDIRYASSNQLLRQMQRDNVVQMIRGQARSLCADGFKEFYTAGMDRETYSLGCGKYAAKRRKQ